MTSRDSAPEPDSTTLEAFSCVLPTAGDEFPPLAEALTRAGATLFYYPGVRTEPLPTAEIQKNLAAHVPTPPAIDGQTETDVDQPAVAKTDPTTPWLLLTSHAAVQALTPYLSDLRARHSIATVGAATAYALAHVENDTASAQIESIAHLQSIRIGSEDQGAAAASVVGSIPTTAPLIVPVAHQAHEPLLADLTRLGYTVTPLPIYRRYSESGGDPVGVYLFQGGIDAIFFPSPEHLRFFRRRLLQEGGVLSMLDHVRVYCWDTWTATVARELGLNVAGVLGTLTPERMQDMLQARA